ncbi:MAG: hypothetical protein M3Y81_03550 [Chloroflexota bacterium]|nr:hypothetical protein [Chloroflexota bacterium]
MNQKGAGNATFLQVLVFAFVTLAIIGIFFLLPLAILLYAYKFGIPTSLLPAKAASTDSQLGFVYTVAQVIIDPLFFACGGFLISKARKSFLRQKQNSPSNYSSRQTPNKRNLTAMINDGIVMGGGREKNNKWFWFFVVEGGIVIYSGLILSITSINRNEIINPYPKGDLPIFIGITIIGIVLIVLGIFIRPYGKRKEYLKIGSEGIEHFSLGKGSLFIPWNEMRRAYVDIHNFFSYLYVVLDSDSDLFYEEPIKSRYEPNIGKTGAIMICGVSGSSTSDIPKHVVQRALCKYAPSWIL